MSGCWLNHLLWVGFCLGATAYASGSIRSPSGNDQDWPQWRGPLATGVSPTAQPPITWSETNHVRWKVALPGLAHSSPIVTGNWVYTLTAEPFGEAQAAVFDSAPGVHDSVPVTHRYRYSVLALDRRTGRIVWQKAVREAWPHEGGHTTGSPESHSPVSDGERVYANFGSRGLFCLSTNGTVLWEANLGRMQTLHAHGEGSSPVLSGDTLIVNWDHEGGSFLHAFDKFSGKLRWKIPRDEPTSWSTPLVIDDKGPAQIIVSATKRIRSYTLDTGALLWECAGLTENVVASPVYHEGIVIAGNSYARQAMLGIRLAGARGDITATDQVLWRLNRSTPYVASPLLYEHTLYFLRHNQNVLSRLDPATGEPRGEPLRLNAIKDYIFASPVGAAGRIYVTGRDGVTVVLRQDAQNQALAANPLDDSFSASAALAGRELYLRGEKFLYCLAED